uniref:hypothetical protein n=2 Tax=Flavobacterium sp. TaxID=239 RepID=UPI0040490516
MFPAKALRKKSYHRYYLIIPSLLAFFMTLFNEIKAQNREIAFVFDKIMLDSEFENDIKILKENYQVALQILHIKRNRKGEIIALKLAFDDHKGTSGTTEQIRTIPIRPIFLKVVIKENGKNDIGFYDNDEMVELPFDPEKEKKITLIENLEDDAVIYIDGYLTTKEELEYLDVDGLESIKILSDQASLKKYNVKNKKEVVIIEIKTIIK